MLLHRPLDFQIVLDNVCDYHSALVAMAFASLKSQKTTIKFVEKTPYLERMASFLATGNIRCEWHGPVLTVVPSGSDPYDFTLRECEYEMFEYALAVAATRTGSKLALIDDIDDTIQMILFAFRRMGAEFEFVGGKNPHIVVRRSPQRGIKYHLGRGNAKIVPQLLLAMSAVKEKSEMFDLFESSRFDYIFEHFVEGFSRVNLLDANPEDELEKRLRKRKPVKSEFRSRIAIELGVKDVESELTLHPDTELASYLVAGVIHHPRARLVLRNYSREDVSTGPLSQLKHMGVDIEPSDHEGDPAHIVIRADLKARTFAFEQLHDFPDALGALALAGATAEGTSVFRSSLFNTPREEERQRRICHVIRSLGVKIAEIKDGFVVEGKRELAPEEIKTEEDPICAMMSIAASLGTVNTLRVDDISPARNRWGATLDRILQSIPITEHS